MLEDLAYRRMLDLYYLNERPFNGCSTDVSRDIGMSSQQSEVDYILTKYFEQDGDLWRNKRADEAILAYQKKNRLASKAGKASAKARQAKASEQTLNERDTDVQPTIKHKPLNINQEQVVQEINPPPTAPVFSFKQSLLDNGVDPEIVETWLLVRKKKKAVNSKVALKCILTEVNKAGITVAQAIEISASESWAGFKAEWYNNAKGNSNGSRNSNNQNDIIAATYGAGATEF